MCARLATMRAMDTSHHTAPSKAKKPQSLQFAAPSLKAPQERAEQQSLADLQRLAIKDVCILVGRSESSVRQMIAEGRFPQPDYRDGPRCTRWSAGLVRAWLESTRTQA